MAGFADVTGVPFSAWQQGSLKGLDVLNEPGGLVWTELYTPDVAAATAFYGSVFGWQTTEMPFPGGTYTMVHPADGTPDDMFGGMVPLDSDPSEAGPYWLPYFQVEDCDATVTKAERAGGSVRMATVEMAGVGRFAKLADPAGARFAVLQPSPPGEQMEFVVVGGCSRELQPGAGGPVAWGGVRASGWCPMGSACRGAARSVACAVVGLRPGRGGKRRPGWPLIVR